jgi:deoxyribonuclease IV
VTLSDERRATSDYLGTHVSTAGGVCKAFERGEAVGASAIQIFTKSNFQWKGRPIAKSEAEEFRRQAAARSVSVGAHSGYLINLGAECGPNLRRSLASTIEEVERAGQLGIPYVVLHPGNHLGAGEKKGLRSIAGNLREVLDATAGSPVRISLETTAGQGTSLGCRFEHLAELVARVGLPDRLAVCFDTCHVLAAGYDLAGKPDAVLEEFDRVVGLNRVVLFHLNDSKGGCGSRIDRHEHIGRGKVGLDAFRVILNDPRLRSIPKILETPKDPAGKWDRRNLKLLRNLIGSSRRPAWSAP